MTPIELLDRTGPAAPDQVASAARVAVLLDGFSARPLPDAGLVILVDDTYRTGWTMTVAGTLLAEAGATAVLPLVLHQLP